MGNSRVGIRSHVTQLIQHWLNEGVSRDERLQLAKCHLIECLQECEGDACALLRVRVRAATSLQQIQALRVGVFNQIARKHHQQKAEEVIRLLDDLVTRQQAALGGGPVATVTGQEREERG